jgi:hypothetical protein|tara:strand:- start:4064 stop:4375 length:312 start_codon:yes stop_codon:yes gene_type:complete
MVYNLHDLDNTLFIKIYLYKKISSIILMLQQFINWFWNNKAEYNKKDTEYKHIAACTIEKAYLEYKSRQRLNHQLENTLTDIIQEVKLNHKESLTKPNHIKNR